MSTNFSQFVAEVQAFPKTMPCCRELSESTSMVWLLLISVSQDRPRICVLHQNHCRWAPWDTLVLSLCVGFSSVDILISDESCFYQDRNQASISETVSCHCVLLVLIGVLFDVDCVSMATCNMRIFLQMLFKPLALCCLVKTAPLSAIWRE